MQILLILLVNSLFDHWEHQLFGEDEIEPIFIQKLFILLDSKIF